MLVLFSKEILWLQICTGSEVRIVLYNWFVYSEAFSDDRKYYNREVYVFKCYHWDFNFQFRYCEIQFIGRPKAVLHIYLRHNEMIRTISLLYNKIWTKKISSTHQPLMPNVKMLCRECYVCSMFVFICIYWYLFCGTQLFFVIKFFYASDGKH